ncbi:hypothetical protein AGABI1DRAFT_112972 [Agaricus bisporus var. burnettii JB137-S8]|uniref:BTB domain-containing protein n=2 Tax=Agaricus bisporus var. burnettii TaxID=192524 RepID=K5X0H8_AGABU|nr:uncharacterized protein AGABI1DRAFT_112972 [Agaricus bisporus var. burnettii JB137-S8]EKM81306.1 hypothetical protein AGABI1DRAFT_112972 [Agaricus bisporus var. burnettii JB137-S8]KAF7783216.1 hypothetical protein Agabi119p4_2592 [Agaricus bisporus var. burnettii]
MANTHRHELYYIPAGDLHLQFGQTLFRIHSQFFLRESAYWRDRIAGLNQEGLDEHAPLLIEGVEAEDFARFLWIFYNPRIGNYNTSLGNWETILRLATHWDFPSVRELAVKHIDELQGA